MVMSKGIVAAGNRHTAQAAADILSDGGNAFDAAIAALFMSFVSEPVLSSPGGGGFLLAKSGTEEPLILDFFSQTPRTKKPSSDLDFHPATARFSTVDQQFHIGLGSVAVPGMVAGLFDMYRKFATLPLGHLAEPAIELAIQGHRLDPLQAEIFTVVEPIVLATEESKAVFGSLQSRDKPMQALEMFRLPELADFLRHLVEEGERAFYHGDIAATIVETCRSGGLLTQDDLANYRPIVRSPIEIQFDDVAVCTNPPPSSGGALIAFSLKVIEKLSAGRKPDLSSIWFGQLAQVMHETNSLRHAIGFAEGPNDARTSKLLDNATVAQIADLISGHAAKVGGTTHISVADSQNNLAAVTVSNGEGCGHMVPGMGFMLNNMLGEEDINPIGFFNWPEDTRITSMMAPSYLCWHDGRQMVLGSGGSNRIRTALVQTICNTVLFGMLPEAAVSAPRLHYENGLLNLEAGFSDDILADLVHQFPEHKIWPGQDFFFGGVHIAEAHKGDLRGAADQRRGGHVIGV